MSAWSDDYETDAIRLFVRDRSMQRMANGNAERLAKQIHANSDQSTQQVLAAQRHRWQHVHLRALHFGH